MLDAGRAIAGDLAAAERREWLCTTGIGGFASGTGAGTLTRRSHGLLVAALKPPLGRTLLVAKVEERVEYGGAVVERPPARRGGGAGAPAGVVGPPGGAPPGTPAPLADAGHDAPRGKGGRAGARGDAPHAPA